MAITEHQYHLWAALFDAYRATIPHWILVEREPRPLVRVEIFHLPEVVEALRQWAAEHKIALPASRREEVEGNIVRSWTVLHGPGIIVHLDDDVSEPIRRSEAV